MKFSGFKNRINREIVRGLILRHPQLWVSGLQGDLRAGKWHGMAHAERVIIEFQRLSLSLQLLIYLGGTGQFLKPEGAIPSPGEKV